MKIDRSTSLGISNRLNDTTRAIARSLERLSTGKSINSARDDVAGFSQVQRLDSQVRGLTEANQSINQIRGLVDTGVSALSTQVDILQQMRAIAVQGSSGLLSDTERSSLNSELISLRQELERQLNTTEFAGISLFNSDQSIEYFDGTGTSQINLEGLSTSELFTKTVGAGSFSDVLQLTASSTSRNLLSGDLNNDGREDILIFQSGDQLEVRLNQGDGVYTTLATEDSEQMSAPNANLVDVSGDGILDLISRSSTSDLEVEVRLGNGDGTFQSLATFAADGAGNGGGGFVILDVDGDGDQDAVTSSSDSIEIFLNDGSGTFTSSLTIAASGAGSLASGDFNGDGLLDLALDNSSSYDIFLGDGLGSYTSQGTFASGATNTDNLQAVDIDNDGDIDLVASLSTGFEVALNDGSGGFYNK